MGVAGAGVGAVAVIVRLVVAAPGMSALLNSNKLNGAAGELTAALQVARSEAIRRNARVTVCASADGTTCAASTSWTGGWIVHGNDNATGNDEVIRNDAPSGSVQIIGPSAGIVFRPSGIIDTQTTISACMPVTQPDENQRVITVMISGIVSTSKANGGGSC